MVSTACACLWIHPHRAQHKSRRVVGNINKEKMPLRQRPPVRRCWRPRGKQSKKLVDTRCWICQVRPGVKITSTCVLYHIRCMRNARPSPRWKMERRLDPATPTRKDHIHMCLVSYVVHAECSSVTPVENGKTPEPRHPHSMLKGRLGIHVYESTLDWGFRGAYFHFPPVGAMRLWSRGDVS